MFSRRIVWIDSQNTVLWCFVHVCFVQETIFNIVWCSRCADAPRCAYFPTDIFSVIQEGVKSKEKCTYQGASARRERQTMFKIVSWTKQTWTKHHNTVFCESIHSSLLIFTFSKWFSILFQIHCEIRKTFHRSIWEIYICKMSNWTSMQSGKKFETYSYLVQ